MQGIVYMHSCILMVMYVLDVAVMRHQNLQRFQVSLIVEINDRITYCTAILVCWLYEMSHVIKSRVALSVEINIHF